MFCSIRLALYVYEYLLHVGAQKAAQTFLSEVKSFSITLDSIFILISYSVVFLSFIYGKRNTLIYFCALNVLCTQNSTTALTHTLSVLIDSLLLVLQKSISFFCLLLCNAFCVWAIAMHCEQHYVQLALLNFTIFFISAKIYWNTQHLVSLFCIKFSNYFRTTLSL